MKNWNATASKFYSQIMNGMAAFFGMDAEETTEAELHQKLVEAGTLENMRAAALQEANDAVKAEMADFKTQLESLQTQFNDLKTDAESKGAKVTELEADLENVRTELSEKETAIAGHLDKIKTLSGEVATLKAGKPTDKDAKPDASLPITNDQRTGAVTVSNDELEKAYAKHAGLN